MIKVQGTYFSSNFYLRKKLQDKCLFNMQIAKLFYKTSMGILWDKNEKRKKKLRRKWMKEKTCYGEKESKEKKVKEKMIHIWSKN